MEVFKFPEIEQFRNLVFQVQHRGWYTGVDDVNGYPVYDKEKRLPILKFRSSTKLHGTNSGIIISSDEIYFQSRNTIIDVENDNMSFAKYMTPYKNKILAFVKTLIGCDGKIVKIYGEWVGKGIQDKVAIAELEKMFVIFAVKIDDIWLNDKELKEVKMPDLRIYNILDYPTEEIEIDFNDPSRVLDALEKMALDIEAECPVAKAFGVNGIGEGAVLICITPGWESSKYWFKVKGDKHKGTKNTRIVQVDVEKMNSVQEFVDAVLTESRLKQGLEQLRIQGLNLERKNLGVFLKWINEDIVKEESDTLQASNLTLKDVNALISKNARDWFFKMENESIGLK